MLDYKSLSLQDLIIKIDSYLVATYAINRSKVSET